MRAVLIEDNPADAALVRGMLQQASDEVDVVWKRNLDEGVKRVVAGDVDVVLLDLGLPDSQGLESVDIVHLFDSVVPIVVLTADEDAETSVGAVRAGAQDYLVKGSFDAARLMGAIRFAIERTRPRQIPASGAAVPDVRALRVGTGSRLMPDIAAYLKRLAAGGRVVYVCVDRPPSILRQRLEQEGVDVTAIAFVDATDSGDGHADVHDLEDVWRAVHEALEQAGPGARLVFDSINALLLQHSIDMAAEFVHYLANRLRLVRSGGDFLCHRNQEWALIADRFTSFLDEELDLDEDVPVQADPAVS